MKEIKEVLSVRIKPKVKEFLNLLSGENELTMSEYMSELILREMAEKIGDEAIKEAYKMAGTSREKMALMPDKEKSILAHKVWEELLPIATEKIKKKYGFVWNVNPLFLIDKSERFLK